MPYAAISYRIQPGHEEEIAGIFADFKRVDKPELTDGFGRNVGRLLGTAVFIQDDVLVRVIHYEGDFSAVSAHMGGQRGVHVLESKLAPYLAEQRDTATAEGFDSYFRNATMRCISELSIETHPAAN